MAAATEGLVQRHRLDRTSSVIGGWVTAQQYLRIRGDGVLDSVADVLALFEPQPPPRPQTAQEMIGAWRTIVVASGGTLADPELAALATGATPDPDTPATPAAEIPE